MQENGNKKTALFIMPLILFIISNIVSVLMPIIGIKFNIIISLLLFIGCIIFSIYVLKRNEKKVLAIITIICSSLAIIVFGLLALLLLDKPDNNNNIDNLILSNECFRYTNDGAITETYCDDEEHKTLVIPKEINGTTINKIEKISMYNVETLIIPDSIIEIDTIEYLYETLEYEERVLINESNNLKLDCSKYKDFDIYTVNSDNLVNGMCEKAYVITEKISKEVPIELSLPNAKYPESIDSLTMSSEKVIISGDKEILEDIESIKAYINEKDLTNNTYKAYLEKPSVVDTLNIDNINVDIVTGETVTKEYVVNLQLLNNNKNYKLVDEVNNQITVIAKGTQNNISNLTKEDIIAYVDLENAYLEIEEIPIELKTSNNKITLASITSKVEVKK